MKVINETPCKVTVLERSAEDQPPVVIVKASFNLIQNLPAQLAEDCSDFSADLPYQDDIGRSLAWSNDMERYKPNFDFLILGSFFAPQGNALPQSMVGFQFGPMEKKMRIIGPRVAMVDAEGEWEVTPPAPLAELPLRWEFSAGGLDDPRNPFGMGMDAQPRPDNCPGALYTLPMIEGVDDPPWTPVRSVMPVNMAPEPVFFNSRQKKMGTIDRRWMLFRAPLPPVDFDPSSANAAPEGQQAVGEPYGNEVMRFANMHPQHPIFAALLPEQIPFVAVIPEGGTRAQAVALKLDTIVAQPDQEKLTILWRAPLPEIENRDDIELLVCEMWPVGGSRQQMADEFFTKVEKEKNEQLSHEKIAKDKINEQIKKNQEERIKSENEKNVAEELILKKNIDDILKNMEIPEDLKNTVRNASDTEGIIGPLVEHVQELKDALDRDYGHLYKLYLKD